MDKIKDVTISIIMPVFNSEAYLKQSIQSVLAQTYTAWELLLVDDGSTDSSGQICDSYMEKDSRIRVIHKANGGVSSARNAGLNTAKGTYVTFLDSDDIFEPDFLNLSVAAMQTPKTKFFSAGVVMETYCQKQITDRQFYSGPNRHSTTKAFLEKMDVEYPLFCYCACYPKVYVRKILDEKKLRFDESLALGEDTCFCVAYLSALADEDHITFEEKVVYHYRRLNEGSLYTKYNPMCYAAEKTACSAIYELLKNKRCSEDAVERFEKTYLFHMLNCVHHEFRHLSQTSKPHILSVIRKICTDENMIRFSAKKQTSLKYRLINMLIVKQKVNAIYVIFWLYYAVKE